MTRYIRMKRIFLQGLIWLYLLGFGFMAVSLEPGFLDFDNLPDTNFSCVGKVIGGYYADLETNCQMFHVCTIGQLDEPMDIRFLCLNGTVFDQETRVCERIDEVDCSKSEQFYSLNLELYGNTQPTILEESPETEQPLIIKSTTTTTTKAPRPKTSRTPYYTTITSPTVTTNSNPQVISTHHFPVVNSPDIRFNPEEINISLHPGAPPDIRTKPVSFHQQSYSDNNKKVVVTTHSENSDNKKVTVTTHSAVFDEDKVLPNHEQGLIERPQAKGSSTQRPHSVSSYGNSHKKFNHPTPSDINYEFSYHETEPSQDYQTDVPQNYHYQSNFRPSQEYSGHHNPHSQQFKSTTFQNDYTPTTKLNNNYQQKSPTTLRNYFVQSLKPPPLNQQHYSQPRSETPQRLQLPLPLLPTLSPLTFSSPAPFSLQHHIETKRYTKDHQAPPRIIISASASVSDASGRRLNYSLGTIGAAEILEEPPHSYDEYKEDDVGLDPFYHDVPKIKRSRRKRDADTKIKHSDIIRNEQEAVDVLKFLFDWYRNNEKTSTESIIALTHPITPELITQINDEFTSTIDLTSTEETGDVNISTDTTSEDFKNRDLFNRNDIIGNKTDDEALKENERNVSAVEKNNDTKNIGPDFDRDTLLPSNSSRTSKETDFIDELFRHEEDYVNDNFEPVAYSQMYDKEQQNYVKDNTESSNKEAEHDNEDNNIKPIYFRPRIESVVDIKNETNSSDKLNTDTVYENNKETDTEVTTALVINEESPVTEYLNVTEKAQTEASLEKSLEQSNASGDTETNDINKKEETTTVKVIENFDSGVTNTEPKSEILEAVTTVRTTTSTNRSRNERRRGRRRFHKTNAREKEPDSKIVVLEKITEKAHTAKDDFNYLRTLYKVYTTTPMNSASDSDKIKIKVKSRGIKLQRTNSLEETGDNVNTQNIESTSKEQLTTITTESTTLPVTEPQYIVPIATTEQITTSTTKKPETSRRNERRRGRNKFKSKEADSSQKNTNRRNLHSRRTSTTPSTSEEAKDIGISNSNNQSDSTQPPNNIGEIVNRQNVAGNDSDTNKDDHIEKQNSNVSSSFVPYSQVTETTTEHTDVSSKRDNGRRGAGRNGFLTQLTINYKKIFEDIIKLNASNTFQATPTSPSIIENIEIPPATPHYPSTDILDEIQVSTTSEATTTKESAYEVEKEDVSSNLSLASSNAVYVPHERPTTTENNAEIIETQATGTLPTNLAELYTEAIREGFIVTTSEVIPSTENYPSTLTQEFGTTEKNKGITVVETSKTERDISAAESTTQQMQVVPQETENYITTLIQEITTENVKLFEDSKEENDEPLDSTLNPQTTTKSSIEDVVTKTEHNPTVENLPTTERLQLDHQQQNNYDYTTVTVTQKSTTESDTNYGETIKLGPQELDITPTIQWTTERLNTYIPQEASDFPSSPIQETSTTENNVKSEHQTTDEIPTTRLTTERSQTVTEETVAPTYMESKTEEVKHFSDQVTTTMPNIATEIVESSSRQTTTAKERVESLEELIEEIQNTTKSKIATTITPELIPAIIALNKEQTEGTETSVSTVTTTLAPSTYHEERITTTQGTVITEPETTLTSQIEIVTTETPATTTEEITTTATTRSTTSTSRRGNRRGSRPTRRRTASNSNRSATRHRFSTETFTRRPGRRRTTIEEQILDVLTQKSQETNTESLKRTNYNKSNRVRNEAVEDYSTDAPLQKSASPTQPERVRESLPTTPLSNVRKFYIFNCFGKPVDKYYPDPRDCRLFHYCTQGYNKNQLLDMKFVCEFNTYFDDNKLICTKRKPRRCL